MLSLNILVLTLCIIQSNLVEGLVAKHGNGILFNNEILVPRDDLCTLQLVESIPEGLIYNNSIPNLPTFEAWKHLLNITKSNLDLASSYWTLRGQDVYEHPSDWQGEWIFKHLEEAATERNIKIRIAENAQENNDTKYLSTLENIDVKSLNFSNLMGNGILHTKLWISDRMHFYVGSANFDWRSLTQVKELGVLAMNCPTLAEDMSKIFEVYWTLGGPNQQIPDEWPPKFETDLNADNPLEFSPHASLYLSSSPPPFCPHGREVDIDAITKIIDGAEKFVYIAVMDYSPSFLYDDAHQFWPVIDNHIRKAILERGVEVKLLFSLWDHTKADMINYMKSLTALNGIHDAQVEAKLFEVPSFTPDQALIPFARVNHNKYMVTDKTGFIGTSNWSADYFVNTGGIGFVLNTKSPEKVELYQKLLHVFVRDWSSSYASFLPNGSSK